MHAGVGAVGDGSILLRHLTHPQIEDFRYFLCGPIPLTDAAEQALNALGVASSQIRTELFELA